MPTSVRLDPKTERILLRLCRQKDRTKSAVVREAIETLARKDLNEIRANRPYEAWKSYIGCIKGLPPDLSEQTGRRFQAIMLERSARWK